MKEELFKKGIKKRLFRVVLALAMVLTLMPMNAVKVYAATIHEDVNCTHYAYADKEHMHIVGEGTVVGDYQYDLVRYYDNGSKAELSDYPPNTVGDPIVGGWYYRYGYQWALCDGNHGPVWTPKTIDGKDYLYDANNIAIVSGKLHCSVCNEDIATQDAGSWKSNLYSTEFAACLGLGHIKLAHDNSDTAKSQPKTGVMDTLPMWFGVMAVSAAAYVLTSKRRFF